MLNLIANFANQHFTVNDNTDRIAWQLGQTQVLSAFKSEVLQHFSQCELMCTVFSLKYAEASTGLQRLQDTGARISEKGGVFCLGMPCTH